MATKSSGDYDGKKGKRGRGAAGQEAATARPVARIVDWVEDLKRREVSAGPAVGGSKLDVSLARLPVAKVGDRLASRGIFAPEVLAERAMIGVDLKEEARGLGVSAGVATALFQAALDELSDEVRRDIERAIAHPKGKGQIGPDDPEFEELTKRLGVRKIRKLTKTKLKRWVDLGDLVAFLPRGPLAAVDHRPKLGPARDQGGRGTCTAFGSTAVAEALEFLRDRRPGPRDLSEELVFWYSKWGQLYIAGGYDCGAALRHYGEYGSCEESYLPYWGTQISSNHAHVPIPDIAMDRSQFYSQAQVLGVPARDVEALKDVLRSGRCAAIGTDTWNWSTATGAITFPDPLDSKEPGASHCVAVIGFIDRDDLPPEHEGGYFIIRNSWDQADSPANLMGPEYGGHLLMPYGWYRRYTWSTYALDDPDHIADEGRLWVAEYFTNRSLRGVPARVGAVEDVDFDWGTGSPFTVRLPFGEIDFGPGNDFSARFTQVRRFRPGWYRFTLRGDDGIRLWVDDRLVINEWKNQPATTYRAEHYLTGGDHVLRVEYYERAGVAEVELEVEPVEFHFELFPNTTLTGSPAATFDDTMTDLEWRHAPPVSSPISGGLFSVRATGQKAFEAGEYRFHARHTGGCRIWVGSQLVLDDWAGDSPHGAPVLIAGGTHTVKVEFKNLVPLPAPGVKGYYRAALAFEWSDETWQASLYDDRARKAIHDAKYPDPDSRYEAFRTQALTGNPVFEHRYPAVAPSGTAYVAQDGVPLVLQFSDLDAFKTGIPGAGGVPSDWLGAHLRRRVFLPGGRYVFQLRSDDGYRLVVDGRQLLQDHHITGADPFTREIELEAGVHDVAIEYANSKWGGRLLFRADEAAWNVEYFDGIALETFVESKQVARVEDIVSERPASVGGSTYSVRAKRTMWLPMGRYRVSVRADDGVRLRIAGVPKIDAWTTQPPTGYTTHFEHKGGDVPVELEFFQQWGGATLELELTPEGFLGEYYEATTLEQPPEGSSLDRNVPAAYRFEPVIDFDWGGSGRLARVGADRFSARWMGPVELPVGRWRINLTADDGVRLFLDGRLVIDEWHTQPATTHTKVVDLVGRRHDVRLEYFEQTGAAVCRLAFKRAF